MGKGHARGRARDPDLGTRRPRGRAPASGGRVGLSLPVFGEGGPRPWPRAGWGYAAEHPTRPRFARPPSPKTGGMKVTAKRSCAWMPRMRGKDRLMARDQAGGSADAGGSCHGPTRRRVLAFGAGAALAPLLRDSAIAQPGADLGALEGAVDRLVREIGVKPADPGLAVMLLKPGRV